MGKISLDLSSIKAAGVYTIEIDNSVRSTTTTNAIRLCVGFSNKGPFNRPVFLQKDSDRTTIYGDIDTKLEHKGCFFNRMLRTLLSAGPTLALNLLKVDDTFDGPDQVNYTALSLNAGAANPKVMSKKGYGEYDYLDKTIDATVYNISEGDSIPFVGTTPYSSLYNRSRFWTPDKELLTAAVARGLGNVDYSTGSGTYEHCNLLNFANVGTEEFSLLVFKPENVAGYNVTAESWYGGKQNIPFGWIRPGDYISDYFIHVICVKGNWTNYSVLSQDPIWKAYFDNKGVIKEKINNFISAEGIIILGSWSGIIIPDFVNKQGENISIERKINASTERTGLLMSFNEDAAHVLTYDYTGVDVDGADEDAMSTSIGAWGYDIDGDNEIAEGGESPYIVDMVGHEVFRNNSDITANEYGYLNVSECYQIPADAVFAGDKPNPVNKILVCIKEDKNIDNTSSSDDALVNLVNGVNSYQPGIYLPFDFVKVGSNGNISTHPTVNDVVETCINNKIFYIVDKDNVLLSKPFTVTVNDNTVLSNGDDLNVCVCITIQGIKYYISINIKVGASGSITIKMGTDIEIVNIVNALPVTDDKNSDSKGLYPICYLVAPINFEAAKSVTGVNFLSYNYVYDEAKVQNESNKRNIPNLTVNNVHYFNDLNLWTNEVPISSETLNMFIITNSTEWLDDCVKVNDLVQNITYENNVGETAKYNIIPGLAKVIKKQFIPVNDGKITWKGKAYEYRGATSQAKNGATGFYLLTATEPVLINNNTIVRQLPLSDDLISHSLRFIPMKGLKLTSRHRPGYTVDGQLNVEAGIEKIYSVIEDEGIKRGLCNPSMVNYRYIIDSMSYGINSELGGKMHLSKLAADRGKSTAVLNMPSAKQFAVSSDPYFCDSYVTGTNIRPAMNTKYIAEGGNTEMGSSKIFSLPSEDNGAKYAAAFFPNLLYKENGRTISVPPAADVANVLYRKFTGVNNPYAICANQSGIITNRYLDDVEYNADVTDREYLEPFGVNTIIKDGKQIMIYGNQTCYQSVKSDFNKLHVRENLNTMEIECHEILKKYNFLFNTPATRAAIVQMLTPVLSTMQTSGALAAYEIICDESNNTPDIIEGDFGVVDIAVWMNHGMEKIVQRITVNRYASSND